MKYIPSYYILGFLCALITWIQPLDANAVDLVSPLEIYEELKIKNNTYPPYEVFKYAITGFNRLKEKGKVQKDVITIIDFSRSSNSQRMWVLDLENNEVLYHTLVAHGKNSGNEHVNRYSNIPGSRQSSIGFYVTGNTYFGKHGLSLYLDGMDKGYNDKARQRSIVMHGADYVSSDFIKKYGRLGRSFGCPAVPTEMTKEIIDTVRGASCLFIYYPDKHYINTSKLLN